MMRAAEISRSGLDVEWQRLQVIAQNLANINTVRTAGGSPYRPARLISGPVGDFANMVGAHAASDATPRGVQVVDIETMPAGIRRSYEPGHPYADAEGFVSYPDINHAGEMTLMIQTARAYEANLAAMNIAHQMYARAIDLGRRS